VQGGSAIPKRYDLPHGDFLKFSLFLLLSLSLSLALSSFSLASLRPKQYFFFVPVLTFANISPLTNIRRIFLNIQNYMRKVLSLRYNVSVISFRSFHLSFFAYKNLLCNLLAFPSPSGSPLPATVTFFSTLKLYKNIFFNNIDMLRTELSLLLKNVISFHFLSSYIQILIFFFLSQFAIFFNFCRKETPIS